MKKEGDCAEERRGGTVCGGVYGCTVMSVYGPRRAATGAVCAMSQPSGSCESRVSEWRVRRGGKGQGRADGGLREWGVCGRLPPRVSNGCIMCSVCIKCASHNTNNGDTEKRDPRIMSRKREDTRNHKKGGGLNVDPWRYMMRGNV